MEGWREERKRGRTKLEGEERERGGEMLQFLCFYI